MSGISDRILRLRHVEVHTRDLERSALVAYRNRVTEVNVPPPDELPVWEEV